MGQIIQLLRPLQWLKNIFVFAPMFFSNNLLNLDYLVSTIIVFFAFCFAKVDEAKAVRKSVAVIIFFVKRRIGSEIVKIIIYLMEFLI